VRQSSSSIHTDVRLVRDPSPGQHQPYRAFGAALPYPNLACCVPAHKVRGTVTPFQQFDTCDMSLVTGQSIVNAFPWHILREVNISTHQMRTSPTSEFHKATNFPAPKATTPFGDRAEHDADRFPPMDMYSVLNRIVGASLPGG